MLEKIIPEILFESAINLGRYHPFVVGQYQKLTCTILTMTLQ
jgi:hypothetical protein